MLNSPMSTVHFLGYDISRAGLNADVRTMLGWVAAGNECHYVACANPHSLVVASRDRGFRQALVDASMLLPDGVGIIFAARLLGLPLTQRVAGYDFFLHFSRQADSRKGIRYFFLGATPTALELISSRLSKEFPNITVCGTYAPPFCCNFTAEENTKIVRLINNAKPDVLWVGMTAPKQEKWIREHRHHLNVPCIGAIGAGFDFYSGLKKRSPVFWQRLGLEWLHRLVSEPGRLWERTVISAPLFMLMVLKELFRVRLTAYWKEDKASGRDQNLPGIEKRRNVA